MTRNARTRPSVERLRELFDYNPATGILTGKTGRRAGKKVGSKEPVGYLQLMVDGWRGRVHQVAFAMHYGVWAPDVIDHINGDRADNRIENLRAVNQYGNLANRKKTGVSPHNGKYRAAITSKGQRFHLGVYGDQEHARSVAAFADVMLNGQTAARDSRAVVMQVLQQSLI